MKKILLLFLVSVMFVASSVPVLAYNNDVIGYTLTTDIKAQINGYDIASYNYKNHTYIVAEDLVNFGFDVSYNNSSRTLSLARDYSFSKIKSTYKKPAVNKEDIGKPAKSLIRTNIKTYIDGRFVTSYNIDGLTLICFDELEIYGVYTWNKDKRILSLYIPGIEKRGLFLEELTDLSGSSNRVKYNVKDNFGHTYDTVKKVPSKQKYELNGKYSTLTGTYFSTCTGDERCELKIYADGLLIFEQKMKAKTIPRYIDLNISGCKVLEIKETKSDNNSSDSYFYHVRVR